MYGCTGLFLFAKKTSLSSKGFTGSWNLRLPGWYRHVTAGARLEETVGGPLTPAGSPGLNSTRKLFTWWAGGQCQLSFPSLPETDKPAGIFWGGGVGEDGRVWAWVSAEIRVYSQFCAQKWPLVVLGGPTIYGAWDQTLGLLLCMHSGPLN